MKTLEWLVRNVCVIVAVYFVGVAVAFYVLPFFGVGLDRSGISGALLSVGMIAIVLDRHLKGDTKLVIVGLNIYLFVDLLHQGYSPWLMVVIVGLLILYAYIPIKRALDKAEKIQQLAEQT